MNSKFFGVTTCFLLALAGAWLSTLQHVMGGPVIGLLMGMLIMNAVSLGSEFLKGAKFASKNILSLAIVLVGGTLDIHQVLGVGGTALPMLSCNIAIALAVSIFAAKKMGITENTSILIGSGTAICGGTAIATSASIIGAKEEEIAYAMAAIFFFDIIGAFFYPYLAVGLSLSNERMGFLVGGTVNDMASVAAAEATFNALTNQSLNIALTIKLARTTLLIPLALVLTAYAMRRNMADKNAKAVSWKKIIPWTIVWFIAMALLNSAGVFSLISEAAAGRPGFLADVFKPACKFLTTVALCGVGFKIKIRDLLTKGLKPVILGGVTWLSITAFAFLYLYLYLA